MAKLIYEAVSKYKISDSQKLIYCKRGGTRHNRGKQMRAVLTSCGSRYFEVVKDSVEGIVFVIHYVNWHR